MKVAFITHYAQLYGANRSLLELIDGLQEYPVSVCVIGREDGPIASELEVRGVPFAVIPFEWWARRLPPNKGPYSYRRLKGVFQRFALNLKALPGFEKQLKLWEVDVIYTNSSVSPIGMMAAVKLRKPHVWHVREFLDRHYGCIFDLGRWGTRFVMQRSRALVSVSQSINDYYFSGVPSEKKHVVYNSVASEKDIVRLAVSAESSSEKNRFNFLCLGAIQPNKGQEEAIRALGLLAHDCPRVHLSIVGGGDVSVLSTLVEQLGLAGRVKFSGFSSKPLDEIRSADALLMCSRSEAMGRVTIEAMACSKPVIGYDDAGTSELIAHGQNGLLYKGGAQGLSQAMRVLAQSPDYAARLGATGWKIAREQFSREVYSEKIFKILKSVVK